MPKPLETLLIALLLALAPPAAGGDVRVDFDRAVDFSALTTFAWREGTPATDLLVEKHIRVAVERELVARGLREVRQDPHLLVVTHAAMTSERRIDLSGHDYWRHHRGWRRQVETDGDGVRLEVGTVVVDLVRAGSEELLWRGVGTGLVAKKPARRDEKIAFAAAKMFKKFPPRPPKGRTP